MSWRDSPDRLQSELTETRREIRRLLSILNDPTRPISDRNVARIQIAQLRAQVVAIEDRIARERKARGDLLGTGYASRKVMT